MVLVGIPIKKSLKTRKLSEEYVVKNEITGHLNVAASWQAIERGDGATIIGRDKGGLFHLYSEFLEMAEKGDSEVLKAEASVKKLLSVCEYKSIETRLNRWHKGYETLTFSRPRIRNRDISKEEWLGVTTNNINNEGHLL